MRAIKRIISSATAKFAALLLAFTCVGTSATAWGVTTQVDTAAGLTAAVSAAAGGDTIQLTAGVTLSETLTLDKSITLDLNGQTLTLNNLYLNNTAPLTVRNGTISTSTKKTSSYQAIKSDADLTLTDVAITVDNTQYTGSSQLKIYAVYSTSGSVSIDGSSLSARTTGSYCQAYALYAGSGCTGVTINGSTLAAETAMSGSSNETSGFYLAADVVPAITASAISGISIVDNTHDITLNAACFTDGKIDGAVNGILYRGTGTLTLDGITVNANATKSGCYGVYVGYGNNSQIAGKAVIRNCKITSSQSYGLNVTVGNEVLVEGENTEVSGKTYGINKSTASKLTITGGTIDGTGTTTKDINGSGTIVISGGSFGHAIDRTWCNEGYYAKGPDESGRYYVDTTPNKYTVTWSIDGTTTTEEVDEGTMPAHEDPAKADDERYIYTFDGWTPALSTVIGDVTYTATFSHVVKAGVEPFGAVQLYAADGTTFIDGFETLKEAVEAAEAGQLVLLTDNISYSDAAVTVAKDLTLDLNGKTITGPSTMVKGTIKVISGTLTVQDSSESKTGMIYAKVGNNNAGVAIAVSGSGSLNFKSGGIEAVKPISFNSTGELNISGGTFVGTADSDSTYIIIVNGTGKKTITGGTFISKSKSSASYCISASGNGALTITGGTFDGGVRPAVYSNSAVVEINGGTFKTDSTANTSAVIYSKGTLTITDGTFQNEGANGYVLYQNVTSSTRPASITGGDFTGNVQVNGSKGDLSISGGKFAGTVSKGTSGALSITGGDFTQDLSSLSAFVPEGYEAADSTIEGYSSTVGKAKTYVAQIGENKYETLDEAVEAATDGDTIELLADVTLTSEIMVSCSLTLDLNGYTLNAGATGGITLIGNPDYSSAVPASGDAIDTLTLTGNGTIVGTKSVIKLTQGGDFRAANLVLDGVTIDVTGDDAVFQRSLYCTITIQDGSENVIRAASSGCDGIYMKNTFNQNVRAVITGNGKLTIHGGNNGIHFSSCQYPTITAPHLYASGGSGAISADSALTCYVQAGYYSTDVSSLCGEGYFLYSNSDASTSETYPYVVEPAANVVLSNSNGIFGYGSLAAALEAAGTLPSTITLGVSIAENVVVGSGQDIVLDGLANTLTGTISVAEDARLVIASGSYTYDPTSWLAGDYLVVSLESGVYNVTGNLPYSEVDGFYHISNLAHLAALRYNVNVLGKDFSDETIVLDADVDISESYDEWEPIAPDAPVYFKGAFDGQGHAISGMNITHGNYVGLFRYFAGEIRNLTMRDCHVATSGACGILAGWVESVEVRISNCRFESCSISCSRYCGMIAPYCVADGELAMEDIVIDGGCSISGYGVGSLTGYVQADVFYAANVTNFATLATTHFGGGFISQTDAYTHDIMMADCVNNGKLSAEMNGGAYDTIMYVGGFIGYRAPNTVTTSYFVRCANNGDVFGVNNNTGTKGFGGFIGYTAGEPMIFENCANTGDVSGKCASGFTAYHNANNATRFYSCLSGGALNTLEAVSSSTYKTYGNFVGNSCGTSNMLASNPTIGEGVTYAGTTRVYVPGEDSEHGTDPGYVARLGSITTGTYYTTLSEAIENATAATNDIYLLADISEAVSIGKEVVIETKTATKASGAYTMENVAAGPGFVVIGDGTKKSFMLPPVAQIVTDDGATTNQYTTLAAAIAAANDGDTVELLADIEISGAAAAIDINKAGTYTIDGNGHTISPAADSAYVYQCFVFGASGQGYDSTKNYTVTNLVITGFSDSTYFIRNEGCNVTFAGCTITNNTLSGQANSSLMMNTHADVTIDGCVIADNTSANSLVAFNTNANNDGKNALAVKDSLLKGNTCGGVAIIQLAEDRSASVSDSTFEGNTVNCTGNAAIVYFGDTGGDCTGTLFKDNVVNNTDAGYTGKRLSGAIFTWAYGDNPGTISGNAFVNNSVTAANGNSFYAKAIYSGGYYNAQDLTDNYFGGSAPVVSQNNTATSGNDIYAEYGATSVTASTYATAFAPNENGRGVTVTLAVFVAQIGNTKYETLKAAVNAAQASGQKETITLLADVNLTSTVEIEWYSTLSSQCLTIDLAGYDITATDCRALWIKSGYVTIKDSTKTSNSDSNSTISSTKTEGSSFAKSSSVVRVGDSSGGQATLDMKAGVTVSTDYCYGVTVFGGNTSGQVFQCYGNVTVTGSMPAISGNGSSTLASTKITVNSGATVSAQNEYAIYHPQAGTLTVSGTVTGQGGIEMKAGTLTLNATGSIAASGTASHPGINNNGASTSGYALALVENKNYKGGAKASISKGTIDGTIGIITDNAVESEKAATLAVSGGSFSSAVPEKYCAEGYEPTSQDATTGRYTVQVAADSGVASITRGGVKTYYLKVTDALSAAQDGETVVLEKDYSSSLSNTSTAQLTVQKSITLDLNGHTLEHTNGKNALYVYGSSSNIPNLTVTGTGTIKSNATAIQAGVRAVVTIGANVTVIGNRGIEVGGGSTTLTTSGTITGTEAGIFVAGAGTSNNNKIVNIEGGSISGQYGIYSSQAATVNVSGGEVTGTIAAIALKGYQPYGESGNDYTIKLNVTGGRITGTGTGAAIAGSGNANNGNYEMNLSGGTITAADNAIYHCNDGVVNVSGTVSITGATAIYQKSGTLNITGGTINGNGEEAAYTFNGNGANATGDAIVIESCGYPGGAPTVSITGGKFSSDNARVIGSYKDSTYTAVSSFVSGGVFNTEVDDEYCAEGYQSMSNPDEETKDDYPYMVGRPAAWIVTVDGETTTTAYYATLGAAINEANVDDTIYVDPEIVDDDDIADANDEGWLYNETDEYLTHAVAYVASADGTSDFLYATIQDAFDAVANGAAADGTSLGYVVTLMKDTTENPWVGEDGTTLDLAGKTLTGVIVSQYEFTVKDSSSAGLGTIKIPTDEVDVFGGYNEEPDGAIWAWGTTVTVAGGTYDNPAVVLYEEGSGAVFEGGVFSGLAVVVDSEWAEDYTQRKPGDIGSTVIVTDGKFDGAFLVGSNAKVKGVTLAIEGGQFKARDAVTQHKPTVDPVEVSGGIFSYEPKSDFIVDGYEKAENDDDETKGEYPWTVKALPREVYITSATVSAGGTATIKAQLPDSYSGNGSDLKLWMSVSAPEDGADVWGELTSVTPFVASKVATFDSVSLPSDLVSVYFTVTIGDDDKNGNVVGVLKVGRTTYSQAIISVPWVRIGTKEAQINHPLGWVKDIPVAELVNKTTLAARDRLQVYDAGKDEFLEWSLNASGAWVASATGEGSGQAADAYRLPRGTGVWLIRGDTTTPTYLVGEYDESPVVTTIPAGTAENPSVTLVAPPTAGEFDLVKIDANDGDRIEVPTASGISRSYTYRTGDGWGFSDVEPVERNGKVFYRTFRNTTDNIVPAGLGFWYLNYSGEIELEWK